MSMVAAPVSSPMPKALNVGLWVVQIMLAVAFLMAGVMKSTTPLDQLGAAMPWVQSVPGALVRFIGVSELAAGIGLVLPAATRIKPILTPLAAIGLVTIMVLAALVHVAFGEFSALPVNFVLGGLAGFVAWGRLTRARITPRRS
jgi:putative oxidoreductase